MQFAGGVNTAALFGGFIALLSSVVDAFHASLPSSSSIDVLLVLCTVAIAVAGDIPLLLS
jgi:hypothetical protein